VFPNLIFRVKQPEVFCSLGRAIQLVKYLGFPLLDVDILAHLGTERFNDTVNGKTDRPVIGDPDTVEINQLYLKFSGIPETILTGGRQLIKLDNDRFVGKVGFCMNE